MRPIFRRIFVTLHHTLPRRQFLQRAAQLTAFSATVPVFLQRSTAAWAGEAAAPLLGLKDNRVLVVVQMAGGNDGLNTLVPHANDLYYRARPNLAIARENTLKITDEAGFPSEAPDLRRMFDEGSLSIVQNVGYPNPDLSHFRSTEIWETASRSNENLTSGWVGRYFDRECGNVPSPILGLQFGERSALTFAGRTPRGVTLANPRLLGWNESTAIANGMQRLNRVETTANSSLDFLQRTGTETLAVSKQIGAALRDRPSAVDYPRFQFSQTLRLVAQMIAAEVPTRVFYVSLGGFDTHATQKRRHLALLQEFSEGLSAFHRDLKEAGHLDRTLVMTFSEFGRRVAENKSLGTDHGTANVLFLTGGSSKPGLHGPAADLSKLTPDGDLIHQIDFRSVYAAVLRDWLGAAPADIVGGSISPLEGILG